MSVHNSARQQSDYLILNELIDRSDPCINHWDTGTHCFVNDQAK